jgi:hypothetical protein
MRLALAPKVAVVEEDMVVEEDKVVGDALIKERSGITLNPFTGPVRRCLQVKARKERSGKTYLKNSRQMILENTRHRDQPYQ